jgi:hypothetical protein
MSGQGGSDIERIADGLALWGEHRPQTPLDWIEIARRSHEAEDLRRASPLFQALCWVVSELDGVR